MKLDWRKLLPGFSATMLGIGFSRFSFTPVSAVMVEQGLLKSHDLTIIAAFMMAAYAVGAFSATKLAQIFQAQRIVRACFVLVSIGLIFEGVFADFLPILLIRFLMSYAGAVLMVLGPGLILTNISQESRSAAAGFIFTGIGFGVLISGVVVAMTTSLSIVITALALSVAALIASVYGWNGWPKQLTQPTSKTSDFMSYGFIGLLIAYCFDAIAYIPHTVYLSDFIASELQNGAAIGGSFWALFGIGGIVGALAAAKFCKIFGSRLSLEMAFFTKAVFILLPGLFIGLPVVAVSSLMVGALVPGIVMLVATRTAEMVGPQNITAAWGIMTGIFALGQFAGATGMSLIYLNLEKYQPLFSIAGVVEFAGLVVLIISTRILTSTSKGTIQ